MSATAAYECPGCGRPTKAGCSSPTCPNGDLIECKSRDGITIGIIDAIITLANVLNERMAAEARRLKKDPDDEWAWHSQPVLDALADIAGNKALRRLMWPRDEKVMKILHEAAALHEKRRKAAE